MKKKSVLQKGKSTKKTLQENSSASLRIGDQVWPMERDILFRPDRLKYVRKLIPMEGCVFCNSEKAEISFESLCVHKSLSSMIVLNKFPYNPAHALVLPRRHVGSLLDLSDEEYSDFHKLVRETIEAIQMVYQPGGFNLGMNLGATAGAGIPGHLHYHIVPRWGGDLNFFPLIAETKVVVENLEVTFDRLKTYFAQKKA